MNTPIDIVYTWVDGNDPSWKAKKESAFSKIQDISSLQLYANVNGRFRDNGELKYSLRSVEKYFPQVGNIYIVTDNQVPSFLKPHTKIHIISHTDII
jgi:hypothetical protein